MGKEADIASQTTNTMVYDCEAKEKPKSSYISFMVQIERQNDLGTIEEKEMHNITIIIIIFA